MRREEESQFSTRVVSLIRRSRKIEARRCGTWCPWRGSALPLQRCRVSNPGWSPKGFTSHFRRYSYAAGSFVSRSARILNCCVANSVSANRPITSLMTS